MNTTNTMNTMNTMNPLPNIVSVQDLQSLIDAGATIDDIRLALSVDSSPSSDLDYQLLNRKAGVLRAINRLQEPIPLMKVSDASIIEALIADLYSQFMMLTELSNVQTIMTHYQQHTKPIIDAISTLDSDPSSYHSLIELIRSYNSQEPSHSSLSKTPGGIVETISCYLNLEKQLTDALITSDKMRQSHPLFPLMTQSNSPSLTLESFQAKVDSYIDAHKDKFPLTQIQGILQGARIAFTVAERIRFNSNPYEPINLIELLGIDLIAKLIAYAKIEASFLLQTSNDDTSLPPSLPPSLPFNL